MMFSFLSSLPGDPLNKEREEEKAQPRHWDDFDLFLFLIFLLNRCGHMLLQVSFSQGDWVAGWHNKNCLCYITLQQSWEKIWSPSFLLSCHLYEEGHWIEKRGGALWFLILVHTHIRTQRKEEWKSVCQLLKILKEETISPKECEVL